MRDGILICALAILGLFGMAATATADETKIRVGLIDAVLTVPPDVERPPVVLLIAGSGSPRDSRRRATPFDRICYRVELPRRRPQHDIFPTLAGTP